MARRRFQAGQVKRRGDNWIFRWREYIRDAQGRDKAVRRSEVFANVKDYPTQRLALRHPYIAKKQAEINAEGPRVNMTFAQYAAYYEEKVVSQYKPSYQANLKSAIHKHLVPYFGEMQLMEITKPKVQAFVSAKASEPRSSEDPRLLTAKSVKNLVLNLSGMLRVARDWGYLPEDHEPCKKLILAKSRKKEPRYFTLEEMRLIIKNAEEPYKTFFWLAAETGMRAGELCALRWKDVDLDKGVVFVRQSSWGGKVGSPKSVAGVRAFTISRRLLEHLRRRKLDANGDLLFHTCTGRPWESGFVRKRHLHPLLKKLGLKVGGLHAFRHGNATVMDQLSVPARTRQARLGHTDIAVTMGYTHAISADDQAFSKKLGEELVQ